MEREIFKKLKKVDRELVKIIQDVTKLHDRYLVVPLQVNDKIGNISIVKDDNTSPIGIIIAHQNKQCIGNIIVFYRYAGATVTFSIKEYSVPAIVLSDDDIILEFNGKIDDLAELFNVKLEIVKNKIR